MKKKTLIVSLMLTLALVFGTFQAAFAAAPPTDATRKAIQEAGVQCTQKIKNEVDAERIAKNLREVLYSLRAMLSRGEFGKTRNSRADVTEKTSLRMAKSMI